jgi:hypothetical protein
MKSLCLIAMFLMLFVGCAAKDDGNLVFRDFAGNVVAAGDLRLPDQLPSVGQSFRGSWELGWSTDSFPADSTKSGKYAGDVHERACRSTSIPVSPITT